VSFIFFSNGSSNDVDAIIIECDANIEIKSNGIVTKLMFLAWDKFLPIEDVGCVAVKIAPTK